MQLTQKRATRKHLSPLPEEESNEDFSEPSNDDESYDRSSEDHKSRQSKRSASAEDSDEEDDDEEEEFASEVIHSSTMTKRQRAKYHQDDDTQKYLELPMDNNKKKNLSKEEQALKRSEVARRRKHQSAQRAEKDKADTINRLLKKQASKSKRVIKDDVDSNTSATTLPPGDSVRYTTSSSGSRLSLPDSLVDELLVSSMRRPVPRKVACEIRGCKNEKKYVAKASGKAVCSLEHYRLAERT